MDNQTIWKIIHSYFEENPQALVSHHLDSYNDFFRNGILRLFKEMNPVQMLSKFDDTMKDYRYQCSMYFGGKDGTRVYYGKPVIHDKTNPHYMYPNEARLRNMTYAMSIHYDIELEFVYLLAPGETPKNVSEDMLNEMVSEQIGGQLGGGPLEFDERDYAEEMEQYSKDREPNFKTEISGGEETKSEQQQQQKQDGGEQETETTGGAGEKKGRKGKTEKNPIRLTTALSALLRETNEKSMVSHTKQVYRTTIEKVLLGRFPIMVQSEFCILHGLPRELRYNMGECRNDVGGYFIIDGKEKTVIMQEKFGDNMLYIEKQGEDDKYTHVAKIRCVSENVSKPVRTLAVSVVAPNKKYTNRQIVVSIPNVREPVPLFIVFRALGIISDREIIEYCLLDREKYEELEDLFIPSVHDAGSILTQQTAILYIAHLTKYHTITYGLKILNDFLFPHLGEANYVEKAYYLGNIVFKLLCVVAGLDAPTDRDNYKYKRVEVVGSLIQDLFREYYMIQQKYIHLEFERRLYKSPDMYEEDLHKLIFKNYNDIFKTRIVEDGFKKAFKGNWGAQAHTKRVGVVQDLNRLSFNSAISHLRKTNLPLDTSAKLVGPRVLHSSHWGFIDPIDTPDGANIGLHKTLSILTSITRGYSREPMILWLREHVSMKRLEECTPLGLSTMTKVMVNGVWAGAIDDPINNVRKMRLFRRNALLPVHTSITFDYKENTVYIFTDAGRLCRPIFYRDDLNEKQPTLSFEISKQIGKRLKDGQFTWSELVSGFNRKRAEVATTHYSVPQIYELSQLYEGVESEKNPAKLERFLKDKAVLDYIDPSESEHTLIALDVDDWAKDAQRKQRMTHMEIHSSLTFGVMCNMIIFPENNPPTRNSFSCGQSKQAVSMYHTNHQMRMDKTAVVLNSGQVPLVKSRFMEYVNHEENPYGENAIVAIMCYTGYNVEDAVLINEGALQRGLFRTTYYTTYEAHEESTKVGNTMTDKHFANIETLPVVYGQKPGYDYSHLDQHGLIKENTPVTEKSILIGLTSNSAIDKYARVDMSVKPKKGQLGMVDKTFITEGEEGERIAKVRIRDIRIPSLGDKMASRSGQKGTVGMVIRECDMPFTADGIRPDIIINPHAIPTRMTIGQLVECITGKACVKLGAFGDCTAFNNKGSKIGVFGELLPKVGFHSSGNDVLYNGMTGEQIEMEIFMGPTYYMRLKHMVKDKINFRATGPRTALTRQPVSGRANDGGLRIGEMERDVLISHGISDFCRESMMKRGDEYAMAICNQSGLIAIYNASKNVFVSPMVDGPLLYKETADGKEMVLNTMSQFGRSFSIVSVPYSLKLLIQELQAMNIHLRIITDQNIHQIESMTHSGNIQKLTHGDIVSYDALKKFVNQSQKYMDIEKQALANTPSQFLSPVTPTKTQGVPRRNADVRVIEYRQSTPNSKSPMYVPDVDASLHKIDDDTDVPFPSPDGPMPPPFMPQTPEDTPPRLRKPTDWQPYVPPSKSYSFGSQRSDESDINLMEMERRRHEEDLIEGGGKPRRENDTPDTHHVGDAVCYVKSQQYGLHPQHPWTVRKVGGRFYTIETDLPMEMMDNSIQVVEPYEIYKASPVADNGWNHYPISADPMMMTDANGVPVLSQPFPMDGMPSEETPQINIAPVIKIINGPDHSTNNGDAAATAGTGAGAPGQTTTIVPTVSTGANNVASVPSKINMSGGTKTGDMPSGTSGGGKSEKDKSLLSNVIDFTKGFFIKKVGA